VLRKLEKQLHELEARTNNKIAFSIPTTERYVKKATRSKEQLQAWLALTGNRGQDWCRRVRQWAEELRRLGTAASSSPFHQTCDWRGAEFVCDATMARFLERRLDPALQWTDIHKLRLAHARRR